MEFLNEWSIVGEIGKSDFSVVHLAQNQKIALKRAVKIGENSVITRYFDRESSIHKMLNHPLILGFEQYIPAMNQQRPMIVTEFVPNGSLADYLSSAANCKQTIRANETRISIIVVGIVLAMRYLHSCGIIHRNLKPGNILLDWDWIVRICDFCRSISSDGSDAELDHTSDQRFLDARYRAPECFDNQPTLKSDVFSFGLILYELLTGQPVFSSELQQCIVMKRLICDEAHPDIPDSVAPNAKLLIEDCLKYKPDKRPSFDAILFRLDEIGFQITRGVNSRKVRQFMTAVNDRERELGIDPYNHHQ
jgi:serine/threonine protein kinase